MFCRCLFGDIYVIIYIIYIYLGSVDPCMPAGTMVRMLFFQFSLQLWLFACCFGLGISLIISYPHDIKNGINHIFTTRRWCLINSSKPWGDRPGNSAWSFWVPLTDGFIMVYLKLGGLNLTNSWSLSSLKNPNISTSLIKFGSSCHVGVYPMGKPMSGSYAMV